MPTASRGTQVTTMATIQDALHSALLISHVGISNTGLASSAIWMPCPLFPLSGEIIKHPLRFICKPHLSILISDISELWGLMARPYPAFCSYVPFSYVCPVCLGSGLILPLPPPSTMLWPSQIISSQRLSLLESKSIAVHKFPLMRKWYFYIALHSSLFFFSLHLMQEIILLRSK